MAKGPSKEQLHQMVMDAAAPVAASFGLEVWGIEFGGAGRPMVRIYVDTRPGAVSSADGAESADGADGGEGEDGFAQSGVSIDQCAEISRLAGLALEVEDVFPEAWVLEVSSPGLDRVFFRAEQLAGYPGRELDVTLWEPHPDFDLRRKFKGVLERVEGENFTLRLPETLEGTPDDGSGLLVEIPWQNVRKARLIHIFPDTSKPGSGKDAGSKEPKPKKAAKGGGEKA